jgi:hypothetical protein
MAAESETDNQGIPVLAGVCSYARAAQPGLGVDATVERLKRYGYALRQLHEVAAAHLPSTPEWEIKCALSLHLWLDAEHVGAIRARVAEMREPPLHLDAVPDERLQAAFQEVLRCNGSAELLAGVYAAARAEIIGSIEDHRRALNPLFDYPTDRLLRMIVREQQEMLEWGREALAALSRNEENRLSSESFERHVRAFLGLAGGICGTRETAPPAADAAPQARWDGATAFEMDVRPRRDARFIDPFNATAKIDEYYKDESRPNDERTWALAYKRLREMDVPEWMAPILFKTRGKPWEYYRDLSRQLWDEARHAMMGEVALVSRGIPFYAYPVDWASSVSLNSEFTPLEAHVILWRIEQDLMPGSTGKRFEWTVAALSDDPFFIALQDYDWADEVLHAQIGRRWLTSEFPQRSELNALATRLLERWEPRLDAYAQRSTGREWWPEFLQRARRTEAAAGATAASVRAPVPAELSRRGGDRRPRGGSSA